MKPMEPREGERLQLCIVSPVHWAEFMGGAQYQIKCLLERLAATDRYDIHYLARRAPIACQPEDHVIHRIGRSGRMPRFGYSADTPALLALLRRIRPHVIYQRIGCAYTGIAAFYARQSGARLIWHAANDTDVQPDLRVSERNVVRRFLERRLLSYGIRRAGLIITQTHQQARALEQNFDRKADAVIPNFHPTPADQSVLAHPLRVVWVANLKKSKNPEAFVRLAESMTDLQDVQFLMVGAAPMEAGDRAWGRPLMNRISNTPNLSYLGQLPQTDVNQLLASAALFVNTSYYEGFPNTFIQSWLRSVPVVSLNVNPDGVFDREEVGFFAETETRLSQIVRTMIIDSTLREGIARRSGIYAREFHSMQNADLLESLIYQSAMDVKKAYASASGATSSD